MLGTTASVVASGAWFLCPETFFCTTASGALSVVVTGHMTSAFSRENKWVVSNRRGQSLMPKHQTRLLPCFVFWELSVLRLVSIRRVCCSVCCSVYCRVCCNICCIRNQPLVFSTEHQTRLPESVATHQRVCCPRISRYLESNGSIGLGAYK
jgi:hypothetical protein